MKTSIQYEVAAKCCVGFSFQTELRFKFVNYNEIWVNIYVCQGKNKNQLKLYELIALRKYTNRAKVS